ncbi:MAG: DUF4097 domain-containing protein [Verrucomicrobiota bacterium]|nr:DUF4097 domain-containing protein [Verrucomicrobiota bacterium]
MISKAAGVACSILLIASAAARAGGVEEETTEATYQVGANPTLTVHNTDGRVFVYGSEAGEIKVKAYKRAFTKERVQQIKANVSLEGDAMTIDTFYPPAPEGLLADRSGTVEYTILVPENCITKVELSQGEIQVHGLRGPSIDVQLTRGLISLKSCYAPMQVSLGAGGVDVSYDWWEDLVFSLLANVREGDISLQFPPSAALRIDAATQSGHVRNYLVPDEQRGEDVQNMQIALGGGSDVLFTLRTGRGNIRLGKPY